MKLYGGLINRIYESSRPKAPEVGMGGTICHYSDRSAVTIVEVAPDGKTLWFTADTAKRTDSNGMSESQAYEYTSNPNGPRGMAKLDATGRWRIYTPVTELAPVDGPDGRRDWRWLPVKNKKTGATRWHKTAEVLAVGGRDAYHDYSF